MGHIMSAIEKVDRANFTAPKNRKVAKATRVFRQDNDYVVVELAPGNYMACRLYGYHKNAAWIPSPQHHWLIDALHAFGEITAEQMAEHKRRVDEHYLNKNKEYDFDTLQRMAKAYGFKLTPAQLRKVKPTAKVERL